MSITTRGILSMLMMIRMYTLITFITMCLLVSSQSSESLQQLVGESITLNCNPSYNINNDYPISWLREDREIFINNGHEGRFSTDCTRVFYTDSCFLTISPLTADDEDTYTCVYYNGNSYRIIDSVNLMVGYGQLPSHDSPVCEIYEITSDRQSILSDSHKTFKRGDKINLRCAVFDSDVKPSFSWTREQDNNITDLTPFVTGRYLYQPLQLTESDAGANFICFMNHPAISESRNCSITPLPALTATPNPTNTPTIAIPAKIPARQPSPASPSTEKANNNNNSRTKPNTSNISKQSYILPIVIALILFIVATVVIIIIIVLIKRRKKHGVIPSTLSYELTYERDQPITAEYEAVNALDSIDLGRDLKDAKAKQYRQDNLYATDLNSTATTSKDDASSLYAKPNKGPNLNRKISKGSCQYENLPRQISFEEHDEGTKGADDGLMYADLELSEFRDSDSATMTPINEDATVYADIKGSL